MRITLEPTHCTLFVELHDDDKKTTYNDYCEMVVVPNESLLKLNLLQRELMNAVCKNSDGLFDPKKHVMTKLLYLTRNNFQKEVYARIKQDTVLDAGRLCNNTVIRICFSKK